MRHYLSGLVRRFWRRAPIPSSRVDNDTDEHTPETQSESTINRSIPSSLNSPTGESFISQGSDQGSPTHTDRSMPSTDDSSTGKSPSHDLSDSDQGSSPATHTAFVRMAAFEVDLGETATDLLWSNDLIMSEVYAHVQAKSDLLSCLLVSKENYGRVAKELYRQLRRDDVYQMIAQCCPHERLEPMFRAVRTLEIHEDFNVMEIIANGSILNQFPNVSHIEILNDVEGFGIAATTRHIISGRSFTVRRHIWDPSGDFDNFDFGLGGSIPSTLVGLKVFEAFQNNSNNETEDSPYDNYIVAGLINHALKVLATKSPVDKIFANLKTLEIQHETKIDSDDLAILLLLCPELVRLSVALRPTSKPSATRAETLSHLSKHIRDVTIINADLVWLTSLKTCTNIHLAFNTSPSVRRIFAAALLSATDTTTAASNKPLRKITLTSNLPKCSVCLFAIAKILEPMVSSSTSITLPYRFRSIHRMIVYERLENAMKEKRFPKQSGYRLRNAARSDDYVISRRYSPYSAQRPTTPRSSAPSSHGCVSSVCSAHSHAPHLNIRATQTDFENDTPDLIPKTETPEP